MACTVPARPQSGPVLRRSGAREHAISREIALGEPDFMRGKPVVSTLIEMLQFAQLHFGHWIPKVCSVDCVCDLETGEYAKGDTTY